MARRKWRSPSWSARPSHRWVVGVLASVIAFGSALVGNPAFGVESNASSVCGAPVEPQREDPKHINLVIDDSGSMFFDGKARERLDRWSFAKYSLEAFAALMGPADSLDVYLMSDFTGSSATGEARLRISGDQSAAERVDLIHRLELEGSGTPYASVQTAKADIAADPTAERWLVILTDGEFRNNRVTVPTEQVERELIEFVDATDAEGSRVGVAFLAIGDEAPEIAPGSNNQVFFKKAATSRDLLAEMGAFANRIFERNVVNLESSVWSPDIALDEVIVFAQGSGVDVKGANIAGESRSPDSLVDVSWVDNKDIVWTDGTPITPLVNTDLVGQIATFNDVPQGDVVFDIQNATRADVFYKPKVRFGVRLIDEQGNLVTDDKLIAGRYAVEYGFMNDDCEIINSPLLDAGDYNALVIQEGEVIAEDVAPGTFLDFGPGQAIFDVSATYLGGIPAGEQISRRFLQAALPSEIVPNPVQFNVSDLGPDSQEDTSIPFQYVVTDENGVKRPPTAEEWEGLSESDFTATSDANWVMSVVKGEVPGELTLDIKAPNDDIFSASTGNYDVLITGSHTFDEQVSKAEAIQPVEMVSDLSAWERFLHWLKTDGWKWLLALLLAILIAGYVFKKRFPKQVVRKPALSGTPRMIGMTPTQGAGKFQVNGLRKWLPFVADRGTLTYAPPGTGFRPLRLKAGPGKSMIVTNWSDIAKRGNVEINGMALDENVRGPVRFGATSLITATTPQMSYDLTPNTSRGSASSGGGR